MTNAAIVGSLMIRRVSGRSKLLRISGELYWSDPECWGRSGRFLETDQDHSRRISEIDQVPECWSERAISRRSRLIRTMFGKLELIKTLFGRSWSVDRFRKSHPGSSFTESLNWSEPFPEARDWSVLPENRDCWWFLAPKYGKSWQEITPKCLQFCRICDECGCWRIIDIDTVGYCILRNLHRRRPDPIPRLRHLRLFPGCHQPSELANYAKIYTYDYQIFLFIILASLGFVKISARYQHLGIEKQWWEEYPLGLIIILSIWLL